MELSFTSQIWKEGKVFVSYCPELDVSSCGETFEEAKKNLLKAIKAFIKVTKEMGTLKEILEEAGFLKIDQKRWKAPELISFEKQYLAI